jgi:hypothetical protein
VRILFTNNTLATRAGTELYVRDVAIGARRRGHRAMAYSATLGDVALELRDAGVLVTDDLSALAEPPDVIHGHHHLETMTALLAFSGVPAVAFCHSGTAWQEWVPRFPRIRRAIGVDDFCRARLVDECGIPDTQVVQLGNFVDLERFAPRGPLPVTPARALVLDNRVGLDDPLIAAARDACARLDITLDVAGTASGRPLARPEAVLADYDVVLAKGRSALEAMAVGAAVVLVDRTRNGPLVTAAEFDRLRGDNFGQRTLVHDPVTSDALLRELRRYDASDAARVSAGVRADAGLDQALDALLATYRDVIAEQHRARADPQAELAAASAYLVRLARDVKHGYAALAAAERERDRLRVELARRYATAERSWSWRLKRMLRGR